MDRVLGSIARTFGLRPQAEAEPTPEANKELCRGTKAMNGRDFDAAVEHIGRALAEDPAFAEAYNQRAIVRYLQERYEESVEDCRRAVEHIPLHFGAWAGMGHCHAHLGRLNEAVACYKKVVAIHPTFGGVPDVLQELEERLEQENR